MAVVSSPHRDQKVSRAGLPLPPPHLPFPPTPPPSLISLSQLRRAMTTAVSLRVAGQNGELDVRTARCSLCRTAGSADHRQQAG